MFIKLKSLVLAIASLGLLLTVASPAAYATTSPRGNPAAGTTPSSQSGANPQNAASAQNAGSAQPSATQSQIQCGINAAVGGSGCGTSGNPSDDLSSIIKTVLNILSAVAGLLAVIMIMIAGVRFTASAGSEEAVKKAKSSIVYAVIGIVIVAVAQILVHFVIHTVA